MHDHKDSLAVILEEFRFLESDYGFAAKQKFCQPNLAGAWYDRSPTRVSVSEEMYDGLLGVDFYWLPPSGVPDLNRHVNLTALVILRHPVDYAHAIDYRRSMPKVEGFDTESLRRAYRDLAALLREYGTDLLRGDWSIEPAVRAWLRAKGGP